MSFHRDIKAASQQNLLRVLHGFLDERGYTHKHKSCEAERNSIDGSTGLKDELIYKRDTSRRDRAYLVLGIILLPTILLTTLGLSFIRESRYTLRTVVSIYVEEEARLSENNMRDSAKGELPDTASDVRVTVHLRAGTAKGGMDIWKPADTRREVSRLAAERRLIEERLSELLLETDML